MGRWFVGMEIVKAQPTRGIGATMPQVGCLIRLLLIDGISPL